MDVTGINGNNGNERRSLRRHRREDSSALRKEVLINNAETKFTTGCMIHGTDACDCTKVLPVSQSASSESSNDNMPPPAKKVKSNHVPEGSVKSGPVTLIKPSGSVFWEVMKGEGSDRK